MVRARSGRGGPREPTPGTQYTNRQDLQQAPAAVTGQPYGQAGAQLAAQRAIPLPAQGLPAPGPPSTPVPSPPGGVPVPVVPVQPGELGGLADPTNRPNEPLTAGSASGPGPGPEILGPTPDDTLVNQIRALYQMFPTEENRLLLARATGGPR